MGLTIILSIVFVILSVYYYYKHRNPFKAHGIPFKNSPPLLGSMWPPLFGRRSYADVIQDFYNFHPDAKYVGFYNRMTPSIMIRDPDLIKFIGVKNFDHFRNHRNFIDENIESFLSKNLLLLQNERWKEVRSLVTPAFTARKMKSMFALMSDTAVNVAKHLSNLPSTRNIVEMKDIFTRYANDVFASCAFGISIDSLSDRDNKFYTLGKEALDIHSVSIFKMIIVRLFPGLCKKMDITLVSKDIVNFFTEVVSSNIKAREEGGIVRPDFIQLMMETRGKLGPGKELTVEDITANAFSFFFGGFETTSGLLCFTAHELAVNPDVQCKLYKEIDQVSRDSTGEVTYEKLNSMRYLDAVINEALRMYPIIPTTDRECSKRCELPPTLPGTKSYVIGQGFHVWLPIYAIQREPRYYKTPNRFDPDRFLDKQSNIFNSGAYLPFGLGPRNCIGNRFALIETKIALFHILSQCELTVCEKTMMPIELKKSGVFLSAKDGFWLKILPRTLVLHEGVFVER